VQEFSSVFQAMLFINYQGKARPDWAASSALFPDSILGVSLFADIAPDQFSRFNRAFVTLFRIAAGDTWIESLPTLGPEGDLQWKPALFVCSFIVCSVWVVLQVSVAVLLDNFVTVSMRMENDEKKKASMERKAASQFQHPLEPLIAKLANEYTDNENLSLKVKALFQVCSESEQHEESEQTLLDESYGGRMGAGRCWIATGRAG
jgi:hypothetical protein